MATTRINSSTIWKDRCAQLLNTLAMGMISRGTGTRLMSPALSTREAVPPNQEMVNTLKGTIPHITNTAKLGILLTKVR